MGNFITKVNVNGQEKPIRDNTAIPRDELNSVVGGAEKIVEQVGAIVEDAVNAVNEKTAESKQEITDHVQEVVKSIPEDYSGLSAETSGLNAKISELKSDIAHKAPAIIDYTEAQYYSTVDQDASAVNLVGDGYKVAYAHGNNDVTNFGATAINTGSGAGLEIAMHGKSAVSVSGTATSDKFVSLSNGSAVHIPVVENIEAGTRLKVYVFYRGAISDVMPYINYYVNSKQIGTIRIENDGSGIVVYEFTASAKLETVRYEIKLCNGGVYSNVVLAFMTVKAGEIIELPVAEIGQEINIKSLISGMNYANTFPLLHKTETVVDTKTYIDNHVPTDVLRKGDLTYVTPEDFGAAGDGVANDTNALRDAIAYVTNNPVKSLRGYGKYKITDTIIIRADHLDIYLHMIIASVAGYAIEVKGGHNAIEIRYLANDNANGYGVLLASGNGYWAQNNNIHLDYAESYNNTFSIKSDNGTSGAYYNVLHTTHLKSRSANAIYLGGGAVISENKLYGGQLTAPNGWGIYLDGSDANKFYGFSMEGDVYSGIRISGDQNYFLGFRFIELEMRKGPDSGDHGLVAKFIGSSMGNIIDTADNVFLAAVDNSEMTPISAYTDYKIRATGENNIIRTGAGIEMYHDETYGTHSTFYSMGNDMLVKAERIVIVPTYDAYYDISQDEDLTDMAHIYPTYFNLLGNARIKLAQSYSTLGWKHFVVNQGTGRKCTIIDCNEVTLFDGTDMSDGEYTFDAICDSVKVGLSYEGVAYRFNTGENDIWSIKKDGTLVRRVHLAKTIIDGQTTLTTFVSGATWTTDNSSVATVANGVVSAVGAGKCIVTASANGKSEAFVVVVKGSDVPAAIGLLDSYLLDKEVLA